MPTNAMSTDVELPENAGFSNIASISLYAVRHGHMNGIFSRSIDFHRATDGFNGARYAIFSNPEDAIEFMGWKQNRPSSFIRTSSNHNLDDVHTPIESEFSSPHTRSNSTFEFPRSTKCTAQSSSTLCVRKVDMEHSSSASTSTSTMETIKDSNFSNERSNKFNSLAKTALSQLYIPTNVLSGSPSPVSPSRQHQHLNSKTDNELQQSHMVGNNLDSSPLSKAKEVQSQEKTSPEPNTVTSSNKKKYWRQQTPGKTAKMYDRHFVQHNYHDYVAASQDTVIDVKTPPGKLSVTETKRVTRGGPRGGVSTPFPVKLHEMLENSEIDGHESIVSWRPHGRAFIIFKPKEFESVIMPKYFKQQSKHTSLQRQLNLYGFTRLSSGLDVGAYYHELFLRGKSFLLKRMVRTKVKGKYFLFVQKIN